MSFFKLKYITTPRHVTRDPRLATLYSQLVTTLLLTFNFSLSTFSQQDPLFNKYMFNPLFINPAYAGSRDAVSSVLMHRSQWVGFDGAPITQTFTIHAPLAQKKMGIGFSFIRDQIGPSTNFGIMANYAYRIPLWTGKLAFGLRVAAYNYTFQYNKITYKEAEDPSSIYYPQNYWKPSFDFGLRYNDKNKFVGLTLSHINQIGKQSISGDIIAPTNAAFQLIPQLKLMGGYAFEINEKVVFKPSFLINTAYTGTSISDINASFLLNSVFWCGITYRTNQTVVAIAQYDVSNALSFGYSYDMSINTLRNYNSGSHEVFIRHEFEFKKSKILSPRYF